MHVYTHTDELNNQVSKEISTLVKNHFGSSSRGIYLPLNGIDTPLFKNKKYKKEASISIVYLQGKKESEMILHLSFKEA